jgi:hypothetical protein
VEISDFLLTSNFLHFTYHFPTPVFCNYPISSSLRIPSISLHLSLSSSWFLEIPDFLLTSNSLHFTSVITFQLLFLEIPQIHTSDTFVDPYFRYVRKIAKIDCQHSIMSVRLSVLLHLTFLYFSKISRENSNFI